jgi:ABC-type transport system substrate-binding protein
MCAEENPNSITIIQRDPMHRRNTARIVTAALTLSLLAWGWWTQHAAEGQTGGGTVTVAMPVDVDTLDLHKTPSLDTGTMYGTLVFDRLVEQTRTMEFQPGLAQKWEVADGGKTWTFHLRKGVKFHDGTDFDAAAVQANAERAVSSKSRAGARVYGEMESVTVVDRHTVRFAFKVAKGYYPLLEAFSTYNAAIMSPAALKEGKTTVGSGPFKLVEHKVGDSIILEANRDFWGEKAKVDRLIFRIVPEGATRVLQVERGEVDVAYTVPLIEVDRLKRNAKLETVNQPLTMRYFVVLNNSKPPFDDVRVRQAVNYAVDKTAMVKSIWSGMVRPMDSPMASAEKFYVKAGEYRYDPARAKQLLQEAKYDTSATWKLMTVGVRFDGEEPMAEAVQSYLGQVGVKTKVEKLDYATFNRTVTKTQKDSDPGLHIQNWGGADPEITTRFTLHSARFPPGGNRAFFKDPKVDELLEKGTAESDLEKRKAYYAEAQKLIWNDAPWIFVAEATLVVAWNKNLKGVQVMPISALNLRAVGR